MGYYIENVLISGKRKRRSLFELKKKEGKKMSKNTRIGEHVPSVQPEPEQNQSQSSQRLKQRVYKYLPKPGNSPSASGNTSPTQQIVSLKKLYLKQVELRGDMKQQNF